MKLINVLVVMCSIFPLRLLGQLPDLEIDVGREREY